MKGFIAYQTYRTIGEKSYVWLFGRLENGESFVTINEFCPYFFIRKMDAGVLNEIDFKCETEDSELKNFDGEKAIKLILKRPADVPKLRSELGEKGIETYEADIRFSYRFLMDKDVKGLIEIEGEHEEEERVDRVYKNPGIKPTASNKLLSVQDVPKLKILSLDIETDRNGKEIYSIAVVCDEFKKCFIVSDKKLKNCISCADDGEVLEKFLECVKELDPDIITGWNVIDFDFKVIFERIAEHGIRAEFGRDNSKSKLRIESDFFKISKADFCGRQVLDALQLIRSSFIKLDDYKLNTAAKHFLGEEKIDIGKNKGANIEELFINNPQKLADYNLKDAELVIKLIEKTGVLDLAIEKSLLTGMPLDRVGASIASLDSLYLRECRKRGIVCRSGMFSVKEKEGVGGYVMDSIPGIYENVLVLDFKSLYPSVIRTFNIDPYCFEENCKRDCIKLPNGACFRNEEGILPSIIENLWGARERVRAEGNELARYAIKILMNSFYGSIASPSCRFFDLRISNSITETCQFLIKKTINLVEEKRYKVVYGDTDSIFVVSGEKDYENASRIGKDLVKEINEYYKKWIKKEFKRNSVLELEFEKCFVRFLMPKIRGGEKGAKKRYAGVLNDGKIKIVGMEAVRGDWTELARRFQKGLLERVFQDKDASEYIREFVDDLEKGKYDELIIYRKSLRKDVGEYIKTTPPHVKAARKMERIGSSLIEYVMTENGPEPVENVCGRIDYNHYIEKQLKPIADSIFVMFGKSFDDIVKGSKQVKLGEF